MLITAVVAVSALSACTPSPAGTADATRGGATSTAHQTAVEMVTAGSIDPITPAPEPALPVTVPSADGIDVTVTDVSRILAVDLYGTLAETVFSLGLGDHVVGRDTSTGFAEAADLPLVTVGGHTLSAEAILGLDPTVVLTDTTIGPPEVQQQLRDAGIPVVFVEPTRTVDGVAPQIEAVATALGVPDAGRELAERTTAEITAATEAAHATLDGDGAPRVAFLYLRGTAVALMGGPGSGADELLEAVGVRDAGTSIGLDRPFTQITSEGLVGAAPDVLLLLEGGLASVNGVEGLLKVPGVAQTPAGEAGRVVTVDDTELMSFGPRTGPTLRALADALHSAIARTAEGPAGTTTDATTGAEA